MADIIQIAWHIPVWPSYDFTSIYARIRINGRNNSSRVQKFVIFLLFLIYLELKLFFLFCTIQWQIHVSFWRTQTHPFNLSRTRASHRREKKIPILLHQRSLQHVVYAVKKCRVPVIRAHDTQKILYYFRDHAVNRFIIIEAFLFNFFFFFQENIIYVTIYRILSTLNVFIYFFFTIFLLLYTTYFISMGSITWSLIIWQVKRIVYLWQSHRCLGFIRSTRLIPNRMSNFDKTKEYILYARIG